MYLSDNDIQIILPQLNIETNNIDHPFSELEQIQPCSIDIRLSNVFWLPVSRKTTIDLRRSSLVEISPRRHWKRITLQPHECITIKPGETLFGKTYEKFSIPANCAGKLEGRSSFARMGLDITVGDFINPGWRGHMPLQLVNHGPYSIKIFPYLPICQLILVRLTNTPNRIYGDPSLQSKYMDDDGGPSYWWRDKRVKKLQTLLGKYDIATSVQNEILTTIGIQEPEILERFENYVDNLSRLNTDSAINILHSFANLEDRKRTTDKLFRWLQALPLTLLGGLSIRLLLDPMYFWYYYLIWFLTITSASLAARIFTIPEGEYLGEKELRKATLELKESEGNLQLKENERKLLE